MPDRMERNTRTTIGALEDGDRFYLLADKRKEVWTKVARAIKKTGYQTYGHFAIKDGGNPKYPQAFKKETSVVFLRHKNYYHDHHASIS